MTLLDRTGGATTALITVGLAFLAGGAAVLAVGHDPLSTYAAIFRGAGLDFLLPWVSGQERSAAAFSLQQTLILTTPLTLLGVAVAFGFRAGMFNIGGQGQYLVGAFTAVWVGSAVDGLPAAVHLPLAMAAGAFSGAVWAAIAGGLKAVAGTNEVISTIMLNFVAIWLGSWLFGVGGPLQGTEQPTVPVSEDVLPSARLPLIWGEADLQGLHAGVVLCLVALAVYWIVINRTVLGYELRSVGSSPEAARYAGIDPRRTATQAMALCGVFAGLAGAVDVLGWQFRISATDIQAGQLGFLGIAVALLGRNSAVGMMLSGLLFAALLTGTSVRNLDPAVFPPELGTNLTFVIQGLVVVLVSADLLVARAWRTRRWRGGSRDGTVRPT